MSAERRPWGPMRVRAGRDTDMLTKRDTGRWWRAVVAAWLLLAVGISTALGGKVYWTASATSNEILNANLDGACSGLPGAVRVRKE